MCVAAPHGRQPLAHNLKLVIGNGATIGAHEGDMGAPPHRTRGARRRRRNPRATRTNAPSQPRWLGLSAEARALSPPLLLLTNLLSNRYRAPFHCQVDLQRHAQNISRCRCAKLRRCACRPRPRNACVPGPALMHRLGWLILLRPFRRVHGAHPTMQSRQQWW